MDEQNQPIQTQPVLPEQAQTKHFKSFWPIMTIGVLSAFVGGLIVWSVNNTNLEEDINSLLPGSAYSKAHKEQQSQADRTNGWKDITKEELASIQSAEWKTYTNEKYGFEFNYPKDWELKLGVESLNLYNPTYLKRLADSKAEKWPESPPSNIYLLFTDKVSILASNLSVSGANNISDIVKKGVGGGFSNVKQISFAGQQAYSADLLGLFDAEVIFFERDGKFYEFILDRAYGTDINTESKILSSFKFINSSTADWQTYTNDKYGFEIKYSKKNLNLKNCDTTNLKYPDLAFVECLYSVPPSIYAPDYDGFVGVFKASLDNVKRTLGFEGRVLSSVNYNGINWIKLPRQDTPNDYITERNGTTIWLTHSSTINDSNFNLILNTFNFIK